MRFLLILLVAFSFAACSTQQYLTYPVTTEPRVTLSSRPEKILVLNTFDPSLYHARKNKEVLVQQLADSLIKSISNQVGTSAGIAVQPLYGFTPVATSGDSSLSELMGHHSATHAIVIREIDVYFDQTEVQVTKTSSGKSREAFYDICTLVDYDLSDAHGPVEKALIRHCRPHSSRSVISGLLAAGPSIGSNSKAFYFLAQENKEQFMNRFFPGTVLRKRFLNTHTPFNSVGAALKQNNYDLAFEESLKWSESGNKDVAARALYNCAVLSERKNNRAAVRRYLYQSLKKMWTEEAAAMQDSLTD